MQWITYIYNTIYLTMVVLSRNIYNDIVNENVAVASKPSKHYESYFSKTVYRQTVTNSMQQFPSWGAYRCSASQEILSLLWNPKIITMFKEVRHRSYPSCLFKNRVNIIFPSKWSLSISHFILLDLITLMIFGKEYKLRSSSLRFPPDSCCFLRLRTKYFPQNPIHRLPQSISFSSYDRPSFTPIQINTQDYSSVYSIFTFLYSLRVGSGFWTEWQ
jgi:hypothetical protein